MSKHPGQPRLLHGLWWFFSPTYRLWSSPKAAEQEIATVAAEHDVSRQQALAIISGKLSPHLRELLQPYRATVSEQ